MRCRSHEVGQFLQMFREDGIVSWREATEGDVWNANDNDDLEPPALPETLDSLALGCTAGDDDTGPESR